MSGSESKFLTVKVSFRSNHEGPPAENGSKSAPLAEGEEEEDHTAKTPQHKFFNLKFYVLLVILMAVCVASATNEKFGLLTTLEKRFGFTSGELGIVVASYDVGHIIVLILMSVIGHKIHQPRMVGLGSLFCVISCILWVAPHIIFGKGDFLKPPDTAGEDTDIVLTNFTGSNATAYRNAEIQGVCLPSYNPNRTDGCENMVASNTTGSGRDEVQVWVSFVFLLLSQVILGAALAPFLTVALTYVDDNTDPQTSAACIGIILAIGSGGGVVGFLLAAWSLTYPVDLQPTVYTVKDPEFLGNWWLGSAITSVVCFIVSIPIFFFPRSLVKKKEKAKPYRGEDDHKEHSQAEKMRAVLQKKVTDLTEETIQEIPEKSKSLATNVVFICCTVAMITVFYMPGGLYVFLPKYYETQYRMTPTMSSIIVSIVTVGGLTTGTFCGGYVASLLQLERRGNAKLTVIVCIIGVSCFFATSFFGCPTETVAGNIDSSGSLNASTLCNWNCSCGNDFSPVCGEDNIVYFSACHAGCRNIASEEDGHQVYGNCSCLTGEDAPALGSAKSGWCPSGCKMYIPYSIIMFIGSFTISMCSSPFLALLLRSVSPNQKAMALGINNICTSVFGTIPAPIIYGKLIDLSCELYSPSCEGGSGSCILYNNNKFRTYLHGSTVATVSAATLSMVVALINVIYTEKQQAKKAAKMGSSKEPQTENVPMIEKK